MVGAKEFKIVQVYTLAFTMYTMYLNPLKVSLCSRLYNVYSLQGVIHPPSCPGLAGDPLFFHSPQESMVTWMAPPVCHTNAPPFHFRFQGEYLWTGVSKAGTPKHIVIPSALLLLLVGHFRWRQVVDTRRMPMRGRTPAMRRVERFWMAG